MVQSAAPRPMDICEPTATLAIGPKDSERDLADVVTAFTKVHKVLLS
jgi:hypothetical protein